MENKDEIMFEDGIFGCYDISFKGHAAVGEVQNIFFKKCRQNSWFLCTAFMDTRYNFSWGVLLSIYV